MRTYHEQDKETVARMRDEPSVNIDELRGDCASGKGPVMSLCPRQSGRNDGGSGRSSVMSSEVETSLSLGLRQKTATALRASQ